MERRLAAILAADVVGYSRLMGVDEAGTLGALKALRNDVIDPKIAEHKGRVFKATGDGILAEFPSVVNAVACAVDIQRGAKARDADLPEDRILQLRIGVNLGDVVVEGDDVFGDGVNVAARLEGIAPPGGVVISGTVRDHLGNRLDLGFEDMGEQMLKNIASPVNVFRLTPAAQSATSPAVPVRGERPSLAVLPFDNMSGDPEQQYFSDGITEDIITAVSRFRSLFVIARNSSFAFRGQSLTISEIARRLGVSYVLEGSVRRAGNRVRITAQLVEAASGNHVWSERFDRGLEDVFAVQDEVARIIASMLASQVESDIASRAARQSPENYAAYDYVLRGVQLQQRNTRADTDAAIVFLEEAVKRDPGYADAHAWLALCYMFFRTYDVDEVALNRALGLARRGVSLDDKSARCHVAAGYCALYGVQFEESEFHHRRAVSLNPNDPHVAMHMGAFLAYTGRPVESGRWFETGRLLNPFPPVWYPQVERVAAYAGGRYADAAIAVQGTSEDLLDMIYVTASLGQLGRHGEASASLAACERLKRPQLTLHALAEAEPYRNRSDVEHVVDGLRKAGLPE